jgi:MFS family permease
MGLIMSIFVIKDTIHHVRIEQNTSSVKMLDNIFIDTTFRNNNLSATTQAGLVNNLNDGMIWGLLPLLLFNNNFDNSSIGIIAAAYPTVWGIGQLFTGRLADQYSNKKILFIGMLLQGLAISALTLFHSFESYLVLCILLGIGTALVYPTFLVVIANNTSPNQRPESIGVFRLWRDLGYALGAILSGIIADQFGVSYAILTIGLLTIGSAIIIQFRMKEKGTIVL